MKIPDVIKLKIDDIKLSEYNPRKIKDENYEHLKTSLNELGMLGVFVVNKDNTLISGHQRLKAMKDLGAKEVNCIVVDFDKNKEKLANISLNNKNNEGEFDFRLGKMLDEIKFEIDPKLFDDIGLSDIDFSVDTEIKIDDDTFDDEEKEDNSIQKFMIIFNDEEELHIFENFLKSLKQKYPNLETISGRIIKFIKENE